MRVTRGLLTAAFLLPPAVAVPVLLPAAPAAAVEEDCGSVQVKEAGEPLSETTRDSVPLDLMRIEEAHAYLRQRGVEPGAGVTVAVLDSGIAATGLLSVVDATSVTGRTDLLDWHGTAVAGLVAGHPRVTEEGEKLVGVAPAAGIVDVRVYDAEDSSDATAKGVSTEALVAGLKYVIKRPDIDIVNISLFVDQPDPRIEKLVKRLQRKDVIVVAAAGNRPGEGQPLYDEFQTNGPGQDAATHVFPAGYPEVVAVSATTDGLPDGGDPADYVLPNSQTDIAAPVAGGVSTGIDGGTCTTDDIVTSWATAEISGVLALMRSLDPDATAGQLVARLLSTATGRTDARSMLSGAGSVQPLDALRRPVTPAEDGSLDVTPEREAEQAVAPEPERDTMVATRRDAVWWGVLGGGALLLALVLRPLLARRGRATP